MALPPPRPPFVGWPLQRSDARVGYAWHCAPNVLVTQVLQARPDVEATGIFHDWVDECLEAARESIVEAGGLIVIHDLRAVVDYERGARELTMQRMRRREEGYLREAYVVLSPERPLVRMAVQAVALFSTVALGMRLQVIDDPREALAKHEVAPPSRGAVFPAR